MIRLFKGENVVATVLISQDRSTKNLVGTIVLKNIPGHDAKTFDTKTPYRDIVLQLAEDLKVDFDYYVGQ